MRKLIALAMALVLAFSLASCTSTTPQSSQSAGSAVAESTAAPQADPSTEEAGAATTKGGWTVTGPIERVGKFGWPFGAYYGDLSKLGYVEEEYFLEGVAQRYSAVGELGFDGKWTVEPGSTASFKTRILVQRPVDPAKFNGTVVCEWANVSAGYELSFMNTQGLFQNGFAYVAISAQPVGVHGNVGNGARDGLGLQQWDSERYDSLFIPDEGVCYDIFTQGARSVGPDRPKDGVDPMGGLDVKKMIAVGESQSGTRMHGYVNGIQPLEKVFDAVMPCINAGNGSDYLDEVAHPGSSGGHSRSVASQIRTDLDCKVFVMNTQTEASTYSKQRQPDTDKFRSWEVAGSVHNPFLTNTTHRQRTDRDGYSTSLTSYSSWQLVDIDWLFAYDAALVHIQKWINGQGEPPKFAPLELDANGAYVVDELGNAKGGVRMPEIEVPTATYMAPTSRLSGYRIPFTTEELKKLYPTHDDYVNKMTEAANKAVKDGVILQYRADQIIAKAKVDWVPEQILPEILIPGNTAAGKITAAIAAEKAAATAGPAAANADEAKAAVAKAQAEVEAAQKNYEAVVAKYQADGSEANLNAAREARDRNNNAKAALEAAQAALEKFGAGGSAAASAPAASGSKTLAELKAALDEAIAKATDLTTKAKADAATYGAQAQESINEYYAAKAAYDEAVAAGVK